MTVIRPPSTVRSRSIDRRRFLEIGALGAAASLTAGLTMAAGGLEDTHPPEAGGLRPRAVIYDERFEAARRFAVSVRSIPVPAYPMRGDVTQLWYSRLYPLWKRTPAPIAGLTAYAAMFCLERLAWDRQLRMVRCIAGKAAPGSAGWPMERAAMVARGFRAGWLANPRSASATGEVAAAADGPLHFWLIASPPQLAALGA